MGQRADRTFGAKPPIPHESALDAMVYRYVFGIVVILSREALFPGLLRAKGKHSASMAIGPYYSSTCASAASVWGSQKVMSMARYRSMAIASAVRACCRWPVVA